MPSLRSAIPSFCLVLGLTALGCDVSSSSQQQVVCSEPACENREPQGRVCDDQASIQLGKYRVLNNLWGVGRTHLTGEQCIWTTCDSPPAIAWGTDYSWLGGPAGQVESYTAALLGWHFSTIDPTSGLPLRLAEQRDITCTWNYRLSPDQPSSQNVAYDIWLGVGDSPTGASVPSDEVMIWLQRSGAAGPIGGVPKQTVDVSGAQWTLHEGDAGDIAGGRGWRVHTFLRTSNTPCAALNLREFFELLIDQGLDANKYVWGIEAGSEIFNAAGKLETDYYACEL